MRPWRCKHEMRLLEFAFLFDQYRSCGTWLAGLNRLWPNRGAAFTTIKRSADQFKQTLVIDVSCRSYDEIAVRKLAGVEPNGCFVIESRNSFPRPFDRAAEWLVREICRVEEFPQKLVRRVLDHFHFFEDHFLFAFEVFLFKTRV